MTSATAQVGLVGLGVMGRNLAHRLAECALTPALYSYDPSELAQASAELGGRATTATDVAHMLRSIERPRRILLMVTAGAPVDRVIDDLLPGLDAGDILIDGGNSHFRDTVRRGATLRDLGIGYVGAGISGGAEGARHGASLMVGADADDYASCRAIFEALAARVDGAPCAARVGPDGAGHFVKMVHNGIEYALMQLIAETWRTMTDVLGWSRARQREAFAGFELGPAASFLVGITTTILAVPDPEHDGYLLDAIADRAAQKGTGRWTLEAALELGVPVPTIAAAVTERMISAGRRLAPASGEQRRASAWKPTAETLEAGLAAGFIASFAQGFDLLAAASEAYDWWVDLAEVARIWQGGCIVRAELLRTAQAAFRAERGLGSLLEAGPVRAQLAQFDPGWREFVAGNAAAGTAAPCAGAALAWYDSLRAAHLPTNLIQAQRDYFGAHGFERTDRPGRFHDTWRRR